MGHKLIRKRITIYSHSIYNVLYLLHLFYLVYDHPNMATCCGIPRYGIGTALGQMPKLKRNSVRLSFDFCLSEKWSGWRDSKLTLCLVNP